MLFSGRSHSGEEVNKRSIRAIIIPTRPKDHDITVYPRPRLGRGTEPHAMDNDLLRDTTRIVPIIPFTFASLCHLSILFMISLLFLVLRYLFSAILFHTNKISGVVRQLEIGSAARSPLVLNKHSASSRAPYL